MPGPFPRDQEIRHVAEVHKLIQGHPGEEGDGVQLPGKPGRLTPLSSTSDFRS